MRILCLISLALFAGGCAHEREAQFREAEFTPFAMRGTGRISGQAFLKTRGGEVRYAAGNSVTLRPATSYFDEWFQVEVIGQGRLKPAEDSRAASYTRTTQADGEGRFEFEGLAPGKYYLSCPIYWEVPSGSRGETQLTGGIAHGSVEVGAGEQKKVVVTR